MDFHLQNPVRQCNYSKVVWWVGWSASASIFWKIHRGSSWYSELHYLLCDYPHFQLTYCKQPWLQQPYHLCPILGSWWLPCGKEFFLGFLIVCLQMSGDLIYRFALNRKFVLHLLIKRTKSKLWTAHSYPPSAYVKQLHQWSILCILCWGWVGWTTRQHRIGK